MSEYLRCFRPSDQPLLTGLAGANPGPIVTTLAKSHGHTTGPYYQILQLLGCEN